MKYTSTSYQIFLCSGEAVNGPDEQGEICVKSPQCFIGYLNQSEKNIDVRLNY